MFPVVECSGCRYMEETMSTWLDEPEEQWRERRAKRQRLIALMVVGAMALPSLVVFYAMLT